MAKIVYNYKKLIGEENKRDLKSLIFAREYLKNWVFI